MEGRTSVQHIIDILADLVLRGELDDEIKEISRKPLKGVIAYDMTDKIKAIIDARGGICEVEFEFLKKLHDETKRFAQEV